MFLDKQTTEFSFSVDTNLGINLDTDKLYFGRLTKGSMVQRSIIVSRPECKKCFVHVYRSGDGSDWVSLSKERFFLRNNSEDIIVYLNIPDNALKKDYSGRIVFYFWKAF